VVAATIAVCLAGLVGWAIFGAVQGKRAEKLWAEACREADSGELLAAVKLFRQVADKYGGTELGNQARGEVTKLKRAIVAREYNKAEQKFQDRPRETDAAIAAIQAARERLEQMLPGYPFVHEQEKVRVKNVHTRYTKAAINDWNRSVHNKIEGFCSRMQYGKALEAAEAFREKWPESERARKVASSANVQVHQFARKKFEKICEEVDELRAEGKHTEAGNLLGKVIRNFGIRKYVKEAQEKIKSEIEPEQQ
jgi:hypothetical protein